MTLNKTTLPASSLGAVQRQQPIVQVTAKCVVNHYALQLFLLLRWALPTICWTATMGCWSSKSSKNDPREDAKVERPPAAGTEGSDPAKVNTTLIT